MKGHINLNNEIKTNFTMLNVEIDKKSGFCFGVVRAIDKVETILQKTDKLYCLGDIVHNGVEVSRLKKLGLITINHEKFKNLKNQDVLIRAHGEPPETYKIAKQNNIKLIDVTCPVVIKLQKKIKTGYNEIQKKNGQIVIFGKKGHAEVNGLVGQTNNNAIVISEISDLNKIDFSKPINVFSQTTKSLQKYSEIISEIKKRAEKTISILPISSSEKSEKNVITNDTICGQVSNRDKELRKFSSKKDIILFVSGKKSSNGRVLYQVCKNTNPNSYFISDCTEIKNDWLKNIKTVGICGATSTPFWLMRKVKKFLENKELNT